VLPRRGAAFIALMPMTQHFPVVRPLVPGSLLALPTCVWIVHAIADDDKVNISWMVCALTFLFSTS
jgi:hypothetical protein